MDSVNYFKVETRKFRLVWIKYSGAGNRTRRAGNRASDRPWFVFARQFCLSPGWVGERQCPTLFVELDYPVPFGSLLYPEMDQNVIKEWWSWNTNLQAEVNDWNYHYLKIKKTNVINELEPIVYEHISLTYQLVVGTKSQVHTQLHTHGNILGIKPQHANWTKQGLRDVSLEQCAYTSCDVVPASCSWDMSLQHATVFLCQHP